jgi:hypothetical protein
VKLRPGNWAYLAGILFLFIAVLMPTNGWFWTLWSIGLALNFYSVWLDRERRHDS